jgi:hypothetical protein
VIHELGHPAGIYERHLTLGKRLVLQEYVIDFYVRIDDRIADAYEIKHFKILFFVM